MAKIVALAAYFYQAAVAFGLLIVVAHRLAPADFAAYSLFVSITQFGAIAGFDWIRLACSRFYPGQSGESEAAQRRAIVVEAAGCAIGCIVAACVSVLASVPLATALIGGLVAICQGTSDLHLTMLRFRKEFRSFSRLQGSRATILAASTFAGTALSPSFTAAIGGVLAGYALYWALAVRLTRRGAKDEPRFEPLLMRKHFIYGSVAAGASVMGIAAPVGLKAIVTATLGAQGAAGALLALDLLQRPFILVVTALQAVEYPDIVAQYDRDGETLMLASRLGRYYALITGLALMTAAIVLALLQPIGHFVVAPALRQGFTESAPFVTGLAMLRALTLYLLPTPLYLKHRLGSILALATLDCLLLIGGALGAGYAASFAPGPLMAGATVGALIATLIGLSLLRSLPFDLIWQPVACAGAALGVAVLATTGFSADIQWAAGVGILGAAVFCMLGARSYVARAVGQRE
jgi:hypothetical protein